MDCSTNANGSACIVVNATEVFCGCNTNDDCALGLECDAVSHECIVGGT